MNPSRGPRVADEIKLARGETEKAPLDWFIVEIIVRRSVRAERVKDTDAKIMARAHREDPRRYARIYEAAKAGKVAP